jgi:hypothetical protein
MNWNAQCLSLKVYIYIVLQEISDILLVLLKIRLSLDITLWPLVYRQHNPSQRRWLFTCYHGVISQNILKFFRKFLYKETTNGPYPETAPYSSAIGIPFLKYLILSFNLRQVPPTLNFRLKCLCKTRLHHAFCMCHLPRVLYALTFLNPLVISSPLSWNIKLELEQDVFCKAITCVQFIRNLSLGQPKVFPHTVEAVTNIPLGAI